MDIIIRQAVKAGVPLLEIFTSEAGRRKPLVMTQHGYLGRKEFILPQAYFFAMHGYFVVAPDAWSHGENSPSMQSDLFTCVRNSALVINDILDSYNNDARTDPQNAGYAGYSMGGMIGFEYLTLAGARFKAMCPVISTPDWEAITGTEDMHRLFMESGLDKLFTWEELTAAAADSNPVHKAFAPVPLLMQNGAADPIIPASSVERFYAQQKKNYDATDDIQLVIYEKQGHADTLEMNQKILSWLSKYLKE